MIRFKRNTKTGVVEAWDAEKMIGEVDSFGDDIKKEPENKESEDKKLEAD